MNIESFLHQDTETWTHLLYEDGHRMCALIDPVADYDPASGTVSYTSVERIMQTISLHQLSVKYIIETHAHADHLSAAPHVQSQLGGQIVIGRYITQVQHTFKAIFNLDSTFCTDGSQFDLLTEEGTQLTLGTLTITALHVPGHTPADMAYHVSDGTHDAIFVGDTLFAPDVGTARCDFPKGSSVCLYNSIQRLLNFPDDTTLYFCHDYPPQVAAQTDPERSTRPYQSCSTVADQKQHNIHVKLGTSQADFVAMREEKDRTLAMPRLILPSIQVNIDAGHLPKAESNGVHYLKIPINQLTSGKSD